MKSVTTPAKFETLAHLERLLELRSKDEHQFMLRTSPGTRAALEFYERAKQQAKQ